MQPSYATSPSSIKAQLEIDAEILKHFEIVRTLQASRNALSPISRLPPEILSKIFFIAKAEADENSQFKFGRWCNVGWVCSHWRQVAINSSELWSSIDFCFGQPALTMLQRSKGAILNVACRARPYLRQRHIGIGKAIMSEIGRIQELFIVAVTPTDLTELLCHNMSAPAPSLRLMDLQHRSKGLDDESAPAPLPTSVFTRKMPNLRILRLRDIHFAMALPSFPQLVELSMVSVWDTVTQLPIILASLHNNPSIERLNLEFCTSDSDSDSESESDDLPFVELPKLSKISFMAHGFEDGSSIFHYLDFPNTASVKFTSEEEPEDESEFSCITKIISRLKDATATTMPTIKTVAFSGMRVDPWDLSIGIFSADTMLLDIRFPLPQSDPPFVRSLIQSIFKLIRSLPCAEVDTLHISGVHAVGRVFWFKFLKSFEHIQELHASDLHNSFFLALLDASPNLQLHFPRLDRMTLGKCVIERRDGEGGLINALSGFLEKRSSMGIPLGNLKLECCSVLESSVGKLKKFTTVDWDSFESPPNSDESDEDDDEE